MIQKRTADAATPRATPSPVLGRGGRGPVSGARGRWAMTGADAVRDDELLAAAADGDPDAWDLLVDRLLPQVWRAALDAGLGEPGAGDVCQVVCVRLAQSLHEMAPGGQVRRHVARITDEECRRAAPRAARAQAAPCDQGNGVLAGCFAAAT